MAAFQAIEEDAKKLGQEASATGVEKEKMRQLMFILAPLTPLELNRVLIYLEEGRKVFVVNDRAERTASEIAAGPLGKHAQALIKATLKAADDAAGTYLLVAAASL